MATIIQFSRNASTEPASAEGGRITNPAGSGASGSATTQSTAALKEVRANTTEGIAAPQPLDPEAGITPPASIASPVDTQFHPVIPSGVSIEHRGLIE